MSLGTLLPLSLVIYLSVRLSDARVTNRAVPPPQTLEIPVRLDENQVYSVRVNMSSNSPQAFHFALSTSTAVTTVAGATCTSCSGVSSYNSSASESVQELGGQGQNISALGWECGGALVREYCGLLQSNGSAWIYPNQTVTVANQSSAFFTEGSSVSGMIGLGPTPFEQSPASNWLANNPEQPVFQFGMALNPPTSANSSTDGGVLHWLSPDTSAYKGDVMQLPIQSIAGPNATSPSDWCVEMDAWDVAGKKPSTFNISQSGIPLTTFLDPFYGGIVFPQSAARAIYADIPGASRRPQTRSNAASDSQAYTLPCKAQFALTVTFGAFSTSLDQAALVVPLADGTCIGALQEWVNSNLTEYLLGAPFVASIYLILSYEQSGNGTLGLAARASREDKKLGPGAIAGVTLGTVAVIALAAIAGALVYGIWRRHHPKAPSTAYNLQQQQRWPKRKASKPETDITPFPPGATASFEVDPDTDSGEEQPQYARYRLSPGAVMGPRSPHSPRAALLGGTSPSPGTPSPNWQMTFLTEDSFTDTNTFAGGTAGGPHTASSGGYRTEAPALTAPVALSSSASLLATDSPPPYPQGASQVPLAPVRKTPLV